MEFESKYEKFIRGNEFRNIVCKSLKFYQGDDGFNSLSCCVILVL